MSDERKGKTKRLSIRFPWDIADAIKRFRQHDSAWSRLAFGPKVVAMVEELLNLEEGRGASSAQENEPPKKATLADLLARVNLAEAASETGISEARLITLRSGDRATELEAIDLAQYLEVDTAEIYNTPPTDQEDAHQHEHHC